MNGDERPWEKYADPVSSAQTDGERPWQNYVDPIAPSVAPSGEGEPRAPVRITVRPQGVEAQPSDIPASENIGTLEDVAKGAVGGLGRGTTGLVGTAGTVGGAIRSGLSAAGMPDRVLDVGSRMAGSGAFGPLPFLMSRSPSGTDIQHAVEDYTGKFYEPKTVPGQYASTLGEFAPAAVLPIGGVAARAVNTVVPALTSETAGQLTRGTAAEPYARALGAIFGGVGGAKMITPFAPATAARQRDVATLQGAGIPLTAGERTGSNAMRWMESVAGDMPLSSGAAQARKQAQAAALDRAMTGHAFDPAELAARGIPAGEALPSTRVMAAGRESLSDEYNRLAAANQLRSDPQLHRDLLGAQTRYENLTLPSQRAGGARDIEQIRNEIVDRLIAGQGQMPGDVYQATRSRLGTHAKAAENADPYLAGAFRDMRAAMDAAMRRGLSPQDAAAWALNNQRWGNMRQLEQAAASAGEHLSPAGIAQSVRSGRAGQYARGAGGMDELARAAKDVLTPLPQSGTAPRTGYQQLFNTPFLLTSGAGAAAGAGLGFGPLGVLGAALAPHAFSRAIISRPVQAYFGNQVLPQNVRDILTQVIMQQTASQPSMLERNAIERAAYERKRVQDRRDLGLQ